MLDKICQYYARSEPSSPVPYLMKRARRLAEKNFMEIIGDLNPDALEQINKITGLPNGVTRDAVTGTYSVSPQAHVGVWQKITTRDWGDVVGSGDY